VHTPLITWYEWCPVKQIYPAVVRGLEFGDWVQTITYTCGDEPPHHEPLPTTIEQVLIFETHISILFIEEDSICITWWRHAPR